MPPPHHSWRSIVILSFHLRLGWPSGLFPHRLPHPNTVSTSNLLPFMLHDPPISFICKLMQPEYLFFFLHINRGDWNLNLEILTFILFILCIVNWIKSLSAITNVRVYLLVLIGFVIENCNFLLIITSYYFLQMLTCKQWSCIVKGPKCNELVSRGAGIYISIFFHIY